MDVTSLSVKIYADGANLDGMIETYRKYPFVKGFTTNPTLMHKAGITDYEAFARKVLEVIPDRPISFEVFSDDFAEMERQARYITTWGENVYVKMPVTNTAGESAAPVIRRLADAGVKQNVTAIMTVRQVYTIAEALAGGPPSNISIFAGRVADIGIDPMPMMYVAAEIVAPEPQIELIWASAREAVNIVHAHQAGCHIITATADQIAKAAAFGKKTPDDLSLEAVRIFRQDSLAAGFTLKA
ncbi:transaldolase [Aquabacter sp. CN5-332]|uniref:transaldolase n=1 Tax=Aquabacter sp. CN5-332 TaxID=3156608 RepID=UPI0032B5CCBC